MGDCEPIMPELVTDDAWKTLANLGLQLSNVAKADESKDETGFEQDKGLNQIEQQLKEVCDKIVDREKDDSMIWDHGPEEANDYLKVVDRAQKLTKSFENLSLNGGRNATANALLFTAHDVLQTAMARLKEEFRHLLVQNRQPFDLFGDYSVEVQRDIMSQCSEDYVFELVFPDVIPDLKKIANLMFDSNYGQLCSQIFINVQREALDDCLFILEVDKLSIEDVLKMEWNTPYSKIRRWMWAIKIFLWVYLASEKLLSDKVFGELESAGSLCFVESSRPAVLQLLNFGEAIAIRLNQPENLIHILDMYEVLSNLIPDIDALYSDETGNDVRTKCQETLRGLGGSAKAAFLSFENTVASQMSASVFPGGGVHPLTRYVMNYINILTDYDKTLNILLKDENREDESIGQRSCASPMALHFQALISILESNLDEKSKMHRDKSLQHLFLVDNIHYMTVSVGPSSCASPMALHLRALISILECNLDEKSKMYRDKSLQHLFLMNNIHYMAKMDMNSVLSAEIGDEWISKQNRKCQQHAMSYERATWSSILALLKDEGIQKPGSNSVLRTVLKERVQRFYLAFEEVYERQTGWLIPDGQLREDLRISTSVRVIQAYRSFFGRFVNYISQKHIKYTTDDLQDYLFHLFEGAQKSLHGNHKK